MTTYTSPTFINVEFEALPSDVIQGAIPIIGLVAGDILLTIFPKDGPNVSVQSYFESTISSNDELLQTGGYWEGATPVMVAVVLRA